LKERKKERKKDRKKESTTVLVKLNEWNTNKQSKRKKKRKMMNDVVILEY
jgi:predicted AAA+ superfamily ATPase